MVGYKLSKNDWVTPFLVIFRSVREKLLVTVSFDHPVPTRRNWGECFMCDEWRKICSSRSGWTNITSGKEIKKKSNSEKYQPYFFDVRQSQISSVLQILSCNFTRIWSKAHLFTKRKACGWWKEIYTVLKPMYNQKFGKIETDLWPTWSIASIKLLLQINYIHIL